jgi:ABC-type transport system substrate-binding protein
LEDVGIAVEIVQHADRASWREQVNGGDFDLNLEAPNQNDANPAFLLALRWFSQAGGANVPFVSPGSDSEFDALIAQTFTVTDRTELQRLAGEAMHQLIDIDVAAIPLAGTFRLYAMKDEVEGFVAHPSGINQRWDNVFVNG